MYAAAEPNLTIHQILSWAEDYLAQYDVPDCKAEAEYLLAHALDCKRTELYLNYSNALAFNEMQQYMNFVKRRIKREPSQYITGEQEFWGLAFKVTPDVLIPRPETELLVEETVKTVKSRRTILDLCAGSGCIAISLTKEIQDCTVYATDISERALTIARENADRHNVAERITFLHGDLFEPINDLNIKADIIVSNPPYIAKNDYYGANGHSPLQPEVKDYEPRKAFYGGDDGLDFYRRIISEASAYLTAGGCLMLEMGYGQTEDIKELIKQNKAFEHIDIKKDFAGIDRVIKAQIKG